MKNKKSLYIIVPVVVAIWGLVIYKIFSANSGGDSWQPPAITAQPKATESHQADSFDVAANYMDPFLKKAFYKRVPKPQRRSNPITRKKPPKPVTPPPVINWPTIKLGGAVSREEGADIQAMLQVGSKMSIVSAGDVLEGVKVANLTLDSIYLEYQGEQKSISVK